MRAARDLMLPNVANGALGFAWSVVPTAVAQMPIATSVRWNAHGCNGCVGLVYELDDKGWLRWRVALPALGTQT